MPPISKMSQDSARGRRNDGDVEMNLNTDQITTEILTGRTGILCSIEEIDNLCNEKVQKVKLIADKSIEAIEAGRKKQTDQISHLRAELINTIIEAKNKINKICEELKKY
ncbi:uncharacterized protein OCT59_025951 [Rhizophagus irregularis]|uniref:Uncharacterized protein n=2 Tax=Rhizophagus irregularis TaxID=588596 RepID=A0A015K059_RHIIW|nr:hypothetical protein RirG_177170 [Rhizophagus irregularis DAOM 197198w]UZO05607.1 hypothetical protein OCT59_025951 [Rhizophagus irregularis]GET51915.1 hypothetical protein GLOIN_2v1722856 [Rhizophagus irregularis DAOM 181602=DAOM 197198]